MAETIVTAEDVTSDNCPLLTKTRIISNNRGVCSTIEWEVRDRLGQPVDLSAIICQDIDGDGNDNTDPPYPLCGQVIGRFADAAIPTYIFQQIGYSPDPANGIIRVEIPVEIANYSGVYSFDVGITEQVAVDEYKLRFTDHGLLSVERGLFGDTDAQYLLGPPTIQELRIALRDTMMENSLLADVEFDDAELIQAIARPLRQWNETPPPIAYYESRTFPFHEHWLKASIAILMKSAAFWYERNRLGATHGGISVDDKNKMQQYLMMADMAYREWLEFIQKTKVAINVANCFGTVSSPYS